MAQPESPGPGVGASNSLSSPSSFALDGLSLNSDGSRDLAHASREPGEAERAPPLHRYASGQADAGSTVGRKAPGPKGKLIQGVIDLTFHHAAGAVVRKVLEMDGYEVEQIALHHEGIYDKAVAGEVDFLLGWLEGSHGVYLDKFRERAVVLNRVYEPYCYWGVPDYVPVEEVAEIADLAKPDVAATFEKVIQGITPGAGISRFSKQAVEEYGLAEQGFEFRGCKERPEECFDAYEAAVAAGKRVVIPHYHPQYLHAKYNIRPLRDPKNLMRGAVKDDCSPIVLKSALEAGRLQPNTVAILRNVYLGNEEVSKLDYEICVNKMTPADAADKWMKENPHRVRQWFDTSSSKDPEQRIADLGIELPSKLDPALTCGPFMGYAASGILSTPMVLPWMADGAMLLHEKHLNHHTTNVAKAQYVYSLIARQCAINALALMKRHAESIGKGLGDIRLQHVEAYSAFRMVDEYLDVDGIMDNVTYVFLDVFGLTGRHSRTCANIPSLLPCSNDDAGGLPLGIRVLFSVSSDQDKDCAP